jgi:hypothetical protein
MKDIRVALRQLLLDDPTVNALVGGFRIHPIQLPQGQVDPSVVFLRVTEDEDYHLLGLSGLNNTRFQLDSWAQTTDQSHNLAAAVHDRLSGFTGIVSTVDLRGAFLALGRDDYDPIAKLFRTSRDYRIWYRMF